jgi:hypothetical protein
MTSGGCYGDQGAKVEKFGGGGQSRTVDAADMSRVL